MMINTTAVGNFKNYRQLQALMGFLLVHLTAAHHQFKTKTKKSTFQPVFNFCCEHFEIRDQFKPHWHYIP